ncbi:MAG: tyrosine-protein phosphatase [Coriobacteriales bacterium]|jgi:protein-tyrosine phosphatase
MRTRLISAGIASVVLAGCLGVAAFAAESGSTSGAAAASASVASAGTKSAASSAAADSQGASSATVEGQSIGLEGVANARQLGGYVTTDGRVVKDGLLLRTAKLSGATSADIEKLTGEYDLGYVCDMRTTAERAQDPDPQMGGVEEVWCSIIDESTALGSMASSASASSDADGKAASSAASSADSSSAAVVGGKASAASSAAASSDSGSSSSSADSQAAALATAVAQLVAYGHSMDLSDMYVSMVDSEHSQQGYRQFFDVLLGADGKAVLWHCTAGKDRAGLGAVLLLSALGVDRETILEDFDLTNAFDEQTIDAMVQVAQAQGYSEEDIQAVRDLAGVNRSYMEKALDHIDETYGSMHDYLVNQIGLTDDEISQLQEMYLEA